jgi:hypothetical protein
MSATQTVSAAVSPAGLISFDLLDEHACEDWVLRVLLLRRAWRRRHAEAPFFTLGMAAYLDCGGDRIYHDAALREQNNQMLERHFAPLLRILSERLEEHFSAPASMAASAAWPGFHIYQPHPVFGLPVARIHRDLQYRDVFPALQISTGQMFSFTLPLSTPEGSGLNLWRGTAAEQGDRPDFYPYASGRLVLHDGLDKHQAVLNCDGDIERITLQGHGLRQDGRILLYW